MHLPTFGVLLLGTCFCTEELKWIDNIRFAPYVGFEKLSSSGNLLTIEIGTPPVEFVALVYPFFRDVIVIDAKCGVTSTNCPTYCNDLCLLSMYCDALCIKITKQNIPTYCYSQSYVPTFYNRSLSSTSQTLSDRGKWHGEKRDTRKLTAIHVEDVLKFTNLKNLSLKITNFKFLSGLFMDSNLFEGHDALLGLAPGSNEKLRRN
ncbi:hypothetical protein M3Y95_00827600 [Aphelenchoides besseyi]|nr:hypothetical protein M3Y95_00827600 [Aphelenchoides besseyi]